MTRGAGAGAPVRAAAESRTPNGGARNGIPVGSALPVIASTVGAAASERASIVSPDGSAASCAAIAGSSLPARASTRSARARIGFRHHDVDADGGRPMAGDIVDQLREDRARPRPLPECRQALVVDLDDRRRHRDDLPGPERLAGIEPRRLQSRIPPRIERDQRREGNEERNCREANLAGPAGGGLGCPARAHNSISIPS